MSKKTAAPVLNLEIDKSNYTNKAGDKLFSLDEAKALKLKDGWRVPTTADQHKLMEDPEYKKSLSLDGIGAENQEGIYEEGQQGNSGYYLSSDKDENNLIHVIAVHKQTDGTITAECTLAAPNYKMSILLVRNKQ